MGRIFKTTATTAIIASALIFPSGIFAAATLVVDKPSVVAGDSYKLTLQVDREYPNDMMAILYESGTAGYLGPVGCSREAANPCVFTWTRQKPVGRYEYRAQYQYASRTSSGGSFGATYVDGVVVIVSDRLPTPTPPTASACTSSCSQEIKSSCICGGRTVSEGLCSKDVHYSLSGLEDQAVEDQINLCSKAAGTISPGPGTGGTPGQGPIPLPNLGDPIIIPNPLKAENFQQLLDTIVSFILWVGLAVAPVVIIIAGFLYVTSAGSPQRIETAKTMITYSLVGVAVLLLATGLVQVLKSILGVK